jgi:hypothetical protein
MNLLPIQTLAVRRPTKRCVAPRIGGIGLRNSYM